MENNHSENKFIHSSLIVISILLTAVLVVGTLFIEIGRTHYANRSTPSQFLDSKNVSGLTSLESQSYVQSLLQNYLSETIDLEFNDKNYTFSYAELGAEADFNSTYKQIKFYQSKPGRLEFLKDSILIHHYKPKLRLNPYTLEEKLTTLIPELAQPKSANFTWNQLALMIEPEKVGNDTNFSQIRQELLTHKKSIKVPYLPKSPSVLVSDITPYKPAFESLLGKTISLVYDQKSFPLPLGENPNLIIFDLENEEVKVSIDSAYLVDFLAEISPEIEVAPESLKITLLADNKAEFSGFGQSGLKIDAIKTFDQINQFLKSSILAGETPSTQIKLAIEQAPPVLEIDPALQERGIKELVSMGYTTYHGSPANRIHNINVGTNIYNGLIIPKGESFSFNKTLGRVDASTGYLPELVIKGTGTVPEYGGGICQVSTTIYRGVLYGGFNVTERYNHSYTVSYYAQVLGDGLDATIYPGVKDFKFTNDTPGDLLIQAFTEGTKMTVRFFGTSDGRKVELLGPKILSRSSAGQPIYVQDPNLPTGVVKQVEKAVPGLSTEWTQKIFYADNTTKENSITSHFRAVSPKFKVGPAAVPQPVWDLPL